MDSDARFCSKCGSSVKPFQPNACAKQETAAEGSSPWLGSQYESIRNAISGSAEAAKFFEERFLLLEKIVQINAITYCAEKFIDTELDFSTPGERGLGRSTNYIPRLGGYYRDQMRKLSQEQLNTLRRFIRNLMLQGYLSCALLLGEDVFRGRYDDGPALFAVWVPNIYGGNPSEMGEEILNAIATFSNPPFQALLEFMVSHRMKKRGFSGNDRGSDIASWYMWGGALLRLAESR